MTGLSQIELEFVDKKAADFIFDQIWSTCIEHNLKNAVYDVLKDTVRGRKGKGSSLTVEFRIIPFDDENIELETYEVTFSFSLPDVFTEWQKALQYLEKIKESLK